MGIKKIVNKVKEEAKALVGKESKDVTCSSEQSYPSQQEAIQALERAKSKLYDINCWSYLPGFDSTFILYDREGNQTESKKPEKGYFVKIILPGPFPENWVVIDHILEEALFAEIKVSPCPSPFKDDKEATDHFFTQEASNTFRVELKGNTLLALEMGRDETINNRGEEAGNRAIVNTIIAEGGWMGINRVQWDKITDYFAHKLEIEKK
jgi:hypothetical protein